MANQKKMGSQISIANTPDQKKSFVDASDGKASRKASLHGRMTQQESAAPNNSRKADPRKVRDMLGSCPIQHDGQPNNIAIPAKRQRAIQGCFGSNNMKKTLTGANKMQ